MSDKKKSPHRDKSKMEGAKKKKIIRKKNTTLEGFLSQYVMVFVRSRLETLFKERSFLWYLLCTIIGFGRGATNFEVVILW